MTTKIKSAKTINKMTPDQRMQYFIDILTNINKEQEDHREKLLTALNNIDKTLDNRLQRIAEVLEGI